MMDHFFRLFSVFGFFFSILLLLSQLVISKKNLSNWAVIGLYTCIIFFNLAIANVRSDLLLTFPSLALIDVPFIFAAGPFVYFFLKEAGSKQKSRKYIYYLHFILPIIILIILIPYYLDNNIDKKYHLYMAMKKNHVIFYNYIFGMGLLVALLYIVFGLKNVSSIFNYKLIKEEIAIQYTIVFLTIAISSIFLSMLIIAIRNHILLRLSVFTIDIGVSILFIISQKYPNLYKNYITIVKQSNKKKSHLEKLDLETLTSQLTNLFEKDKIYHDDELTLGILSEKLNINVHQLSEFLNNHMNHNFSSFLSLHRVEEAKILLSKESDASIISIAYKVGFNSISSFNRAFKKFTGVSPNQFRNSPSG